MNPAHRPSISLKRVLLALVPLVLVFGAVGLYAARSDNRSLDQKQQSIEKLVMASFSSGERPVDRLGDAFSDADGDLVADPPEAERQIDPERLFFSYIGSEESVEDAAKWQPLVEHLQTATDKTVEFVPISTVDDQLAALASGDLHITGFNSGAVPLAVNQYGFIPVCTYGDDQGKFGYRMEIIVRAASPIRDVKQLAGREIAFTHLRSNSGFKAAFVLLASDFGLFPERDYAWAFSGGHDASIRAVEAGKYPAAAVASDLLERAIAQGLVKQKSLRSIYQSESFPPAAIGYVYTLRPELAAKIRAGLLSFDLAASPLAAEFQHAGGIKFTPVSYKDDWALIRRIDSQLHSLRDQRLAPNVDRQADSR